MKPALKICALALAVASTCTYADEALDTSDSLWQLSPEELGQVRLTSIATGTVTPLDKSAAITTVITEADIKSIGATDLDDVLETVPGLHVSRWYQAYAPKYVFRGITSSYNPQALILINGIPATNLAFGNRGNIWAGMPLKSVARIEVIRGPGSALYGADAFGGVINIITKSRKDIDGTETGVRAGSFDTQAAWVLHGGSYDGFDVGFTLEASKTDGQHETIQADAQTAFDQGFATSASLAPGGVNLGRKQIESRLDIEKDNLHFRAGYQGRYDVQTGAGIAQALDPYGLYRSDRVNSDLTYTRDDLAKDWSFVGQVSYYYDTQDPTRDGIVFPPGVDLTAIGGSLFPEGLIGNPGYKEQNARAQVTSLYSGLKDHRIRLGVGSFWGSLFQTTETKNFNPNLTARSGGITDVSDTAEVWLPEKSRTNAYAFVQDEWQFAQDWQLTSGARFDHYSDFGDTTNPRLALIWATTDTITTKLLYGRAFRAPSITELFVTSNPVSLGNPDLKPEKIDTYEFALSQQLTKEIHYSLNLFYYKIRDYIDFVAQTNGTAKAENIGRRKGRGGEFEINYVVTPTWTLLANYSYQRATDEITHTDVGDAPNHEIYGRSELSFLENWRFDLQTNWVGRQKRVNGDPRSPVDAYTTVDVTLRNTRVISGLELAVSVRNLFNSAVFEPTNATIPGDLPMAGINFYGEAEYRF